MRTCKECLSKASLGDYFIYQKSVMRSVVNISVDQIAIWHQGEETRLERNGVDKIIGPQLVTLHKQSPFSELLVLNGP